MTFFWGAAAIPAAAGGVSIDDRTVSDTEVTPDIARAYYRLNSNGSVYGGQSPTTFLEVWRDAGASADYQVRATYISGTRVPSGTFNTWLSLSTTRDWQLFTDGDGGAVWNATVLFEIRSATTFVVLDSASVFFFVDEEG